MSKKNTPWAHAKSIYDIELDFFLKLGIDTLLCDLDNTIDVHRNALPSEEVMLFKKELDLKHVRLVIISNNNEARVSKYANFLGVSYLAKANKPTTKKAIKFLESIGINDREKVLYVGDQVINDIRFANKLGIRTILTEPLRNDDQFVTRFVRLWDKPLRKSLEKKNRLVNWREHYDH